MVMFVHFFSLIIISILVVVFKTQANFLLNLIKSAHGYLLSKLSLVIPAGFFGGITQQIFALLIMCVVVALVILLGYWLVKRTMMPNFFPMLWYIWIILLVTLTLNR